MQDHPTRDEFYARMRELFGNRVKWIVDGFNKHYPQNLTMPFAYPGSISKSSIAFFEWSMEPWCPSIEFMSDCTAYWHNLNLDTDVVREEWLDMSTQEGWERLAVLVGGCVDA